jgi:RNA recognition motif-containing protein
MNIFVGNLPFGMTDDELHELFAKFGEITRATVIKDRVTGKSRGFGFVEMADDEMARAAIEGLNGSDMQGRALTVNEARPRESRPRTGGGGGYNGGGGGGGYSGGGGGGGGYSGGGGGSGGGGSGGYGGGGGRY